MKIDGYSTRPIQKGMYRIVDPSGVPSVLFSATREPPTAPEPDAGTHTATVSSPAIRGVKLSETASEKCSPCSFKPPA